MPSVFSVVKPESSNAMIDTTTEQTESPETLRSLIADEQGATTLEWALLLAAIGIPSWYIMQTAIHALTGHYQMMTAINSLPFP